MIWIFYSLIANIGIAIMENIYRRGLFDNFHGALPYILLPILLTQFALFHSFRGAPSLFMAWAVLTFVNSLFRVINNVYLGEPLTPVIVLGLMLMLLGTVLIKGA